MLRVPGRPQAGTLVSWALLIAWVGDLNCQAIGATLSHWYRIRV